MAMTEEEKREKLLKLKYDKYKTGVTVLFGACITFYVSAIILVSKEYAGETFFWTVPLSGSAIFLILSLLQSLKMKKYRKKLAKMYAPKEDDQSEQKKERRGCNG